MATNGLARYSIRLQMDAPMSDRRLPAKERIRVLLLKGVNQSAADLVTQSGYSNVTRLPGALEDSALREAVRGVHLLGIRSRTQTRRCL